MEVFILKGFKSCVLEVLIPGELVALFAEVQILNGLGAKEETDIGYVVEHQKAKTPARRWRYGDKAQCYPETTIRGE